MTIFWFLFLWIFFWELYFKSQPNKKTQQIALSLFGIWLVFALRSPYCGTDLMSSDIKDTSYYAIFYYAQDARWSSILANNQFEAVEVGFKIYSKILSLLTSSFQIYLAINAFFILFPLGLFIRKYSKDVSLSIICYICLGLFVFNFSGLRQSLAISLAIYAYCLLSDSKKVLALIAFVISYFLHNSALVFLLPFVFSKLYISKKWGIILLLLLLFVIPYFRDIIGYLSNLVFGGRYFGYQDEGGHITMALVYAAIFIAYLFVNDNKIDNRSMVRHMAFLAVVCQSLGTISSGAMTRIGYYFDVFHLTIIPEILIGLHLKNRQLGRAVLIMLLILFFWLTTKDGYLNVVPYRFFWE